MHLYEMLPRYTCSSYLFLLLEFVELSKMLRYDSQNMVHIFVVYSYTILNGILRDRQRFFSYNFTQILYIDWY